MIGSQSNADLPRSLEELCSYEGTGGRYLVRFDALLFPQGFLVHEILVSKWIQATNLEIGWRETLMSL
jgi:hypothetical protein